MIDCPISNARELVHRAITRIPTEMLQCTDRGIRYLDFILNEQVGKSLGGCKKQLSVRRSFVIALFCGNSDRDWWAIFWSYSDKQIAFAAGNANAI